ncbi:GNAT family N-acetyltransferase [Clostridium oryzae]|uniref:Putative acetyltransferase n=1 Tax=Clostridium oryzae TaxID=1450648 RepID=A0A1V4IL59_9CLOT|nr:GNAT family N-acetyltransferase [Clostridium oryzae]OPJ60778.1 putative acetyltransferase [Clostridium oryzae]
MEFKEISFNDEKVINEGMRLWNDNLGAVYPMDYKLFSQNLRGDRQNKKMVGVFDEGKLIAFIVYKQSIYKSGLLEPDRQVGYINSIIVDMHYRKQGIAKKLLSEAEKDLKAAGVKNIHVAGDTYHFFPGIPSECIFAEEFFNSMGYKIEGESYDLIADISKVDFSRLPGISLNRDSRYAVKLLDINEKAELYSFFERCFPGRWYEEFLEFFEMGMEDRDVVVMKDGDKIIGFAHIYDNKSKFIGAPVYWRQSLGSNYGGLGPIGIDEAYRKCGLGLLILYKALEILKQRNVENMVIDWTSRQIINYYGKFNFMPWRKYKHATKVEDL